MAREQASHASVAAVDWNGRLRAKPLAAAPFAQAFEQGVALTSAIFAVDHAEHPIRTSRFQDPANGYRDALLQCRRDEIYHDPFAPEDGTPLAFGDLLPPHDVYCPRAILRREVAALAQYGLQAFGAYEYEHHLLQETPQTLHVKTPTTLQRLPTLSRMYSYVDQSLIGDLRSETLAAAARAGVDIESLHAEFTGLLETALAPRHGMAIADGALLYKSIAKTIARRHDLLAVFMARLADDFETAGAHLNVSLQDEVGRPVFFDEAVPLRLTDTALQFIAGLQRYLPELALLLLPNVNSYKRFRGDSFAPRVNAWGIDNKTCAFRVINVSPAACRIEIRVPGADVHPHLALAAVLVAGRAGLAEALRPLPPVDGDAARSPHCGTPFPASLQEALSAWRTSPLAARVFGREFVDAFAETRDWQQAQLAATVTDWELRQFGEGA